MELTFTRYQERASETAIYPRDNGQALSYLALGVNGEAGEIAEHLIGVQAGELEDEAAGLLGKEIGDELWYLAMLCFEEDRDMGAVAAANLADLGVTGNGDRLTFTDFQDAVAETIRYTRDGDQLRDLGLRINSEASKIAECAKKAIRDNGGQLAPEKAELVFASLGHVLRWAAVLCSELGVDFGRVAKDNLDKLASRKERGVLKGSGDTR